MRMPSSRIVPRRRQWGIVRCITTVAKHPRSWVGISWNMLACAMCVCRFLWMYENVRMHVCRFMYVFVYLCICVCVCYVHVCTYVCVCYACMYVRMCVVCMCVCLNVWIYTYVWTHALGDASLYNISACRYTCFCAFTRVSPRTRCMSVHCILGAYIYLEEFIECSGWSVKTTTSYSYSGAYDSRQPLWTPPGSRKWFFTIEMRFMTSWYHADWEVSMSSMTGMRCCCSLFSVR